MNGYQKEEHKNIIQRKQEKVCKAMAMYLQIFDMIREVDNNWRRQVFQGEDQFDPKTDRAIRSLYALWAAYSEMFEEQAKYLSRHGANFNSQLNKVSNNKREAIELLRTWEPPVLSMAPSFRAASLTADAANRTRELFPGAI